MFCCLKLYVSLGNYTILILGDTVLLSLDIVFRLDCSNNQDDT